MSDLKPILDEIAFWHWWIFAVVLVAAEAVLPGAFFLWMGISAALVGIAVLVAPDLGWEIQWIAFALISVGSVVGWRAYLRKHPTETDEPTLNKRSEGYVGRRLTLSQDFQNGAGRTKVDDTIWNVEDADGTDLTEGTKVQVTAVRDTVLVVRAID